MKKIEIEVYSVDEKLPNDGQMVLMCTTWDKFYEAEFVIGVESGKPLFVVNQGKPAWREQEYRAYELTSVKSWCELPNFNL